MSFLWALLYTIMSLLLSIPILHGLAATLHSPLLTFLTRALATIFATCLCASYGVVASIVLRLTGYGGLSQWTVARSYKYTMWALTGVNFNISDPSNALSTRPAVFVGNHQAELDVLMLGHIFPPYCSVTSKESLKYVPFLGWFMLLSKTVFINRADSKGAKAAFAGAVRTMQTDRQSVFIFPEGTRSYADTPRMLPFKKGAFHLAVQAGVPVVPVVTANYSALLNIKKRIFNTGEIPISVLPAIETKGMTADDVAALTEKVRVLMETELLRISKVAQSEGGFGSGKGANGVPQAIKQ